MLFENVIARQGHPTSIAEQVDTVFGTDLADTAGERKDK